MRHQPERGGGDRQKEWPGGREGTHVLKQAAPRSAHPHLCAARKGTHGGQGFAERGMHCLRRRPCRNPARSRGGPHRPRRRRRCRRHPVRGDRHQAADFDASAVTDAEVADAVAAAAAAAALAGASIVTTTAAVATNAALMVVDAASIAGDIDISIRRLTAQPSGVGRRSDRRR